MSISSVGNYNSVSLYIEGSLLWTLSGPISGNLVAGIAVMISILINKTSKSNVIRIINDTYIINISLNDPDSLNLAFSQYLIADQISLPNFNDYHPDNYNYGLFIKHHNLYNLYTFSDPEFIQGIITICDAFNVDFRDYVAGMPFKYINQNKIYYAIEGYIITSLKSEPRVPLDKEGFFVDSY